jgi:hypothetical protein
MPQEQPIGPPGVDLQAQRIRFDYIKSSFFRVVHAEGMLGGIGPRGFIQMAIFNERWPIPKQATHELSADGKLGNEIMSERISRDAVVREVEVEVLMDLNTAKQMLIWLQDRISEIEKSARSKENACQANG